MKSSGGTAGRAATSSNVLSTLTLITQASCFAVNQMLTGSYCKAASEKGTAATAIPYELLCNAACIDSNRETTFPQNHKWKGEVILFFWSNWDRSNLVQLPSMNFRSADLVSQAVKSLDLLNGPWEQDARLLNSKRITGASLRIYLATLGTNQNHRIIKNIE